MCVCSSNGGPNHTLHSFNTSLFSCHFLHTAAAFQLYPTLNNPQVPAQSFEQGRCDGLMELRCVSSTSATTPKPHLTTVCKCVFVCRVWLTGRMLLVFPLIFSLSLTVSLCVCLTTHPVNKLQPGAGNLTSSILLHRQYLGIFASPACLPSSLENSQHQVGQSLFLHTYLAHIVPPLVGEKPPPASKQLLFPISISGSKVPSLSLTPFLLCCKPTAPVISLY